MATATASPPPQQPAAPTPPPPAPSVVVARGAAELAAHAAAWDRLAAAAVEPNPFYEPWMFLPALAAFGARDDVTCALAYVPDPVNPQAPRILGGLFPLQRARRYKGFPVPVLRFWKHQHCFF